MKKLLSMILIAFLAAGLLFAGGGSEKSAEEAPAPAASPAKAVYDKDHHIPEGTPPAGPIELVMWHEVSNVVQETLAEAAENFNKSQDLYHVTVMFTSNILTKVLTSNVEDRPNIVQATGNTSSTYTVPKIDSRFDDPGLYVPLQVFIDHDKFDVSRIIKNSVSICVRGGQWQIFPLGNTDSGIYVNYDMLAQVGMKPEDLKSYEDVYEACRRMKEQLGKGGMLFMYQHVDPMNFAIAAEGVQLFNNDNGRSGVPDKVLFAEEGEAKDSMMAWLNFVTKMRDEGLICDPSVGSSDARLMFANGEIAFFLQTLSSYSTIESRHPEFNWGFLPSPTVRAGKANLGQSPGGRFILVTDVDDPWKEYGSWLFVKYLMEDEWAARFAMNVGYIPTTVSAAEWGDYKTYLESHPDLAAVREAQNSTPEGICMPLLAYQTDYAGAYADLLKKMLMVETDMTAEQAYETLVKNTKEAVEMYFLSAGIVI